MGSGSAFAARGNGTQSDTQSHSRRDRQQTEAPKTRMRKISVVDSHTAGEPTRVVVEGGPELGKGNVAERLKIFREKHDVFRSAIVNEPRGSDVLVGALLVKPSNPNCIAG